MEEKPAYKQGSTDQNSNRTNTLTVSTLITPYVIAIPSYKRATLLLHKTLKMLYRHKINPRIIYIFLANNQEYQEYTTTYSDPLVIADYKIPDGYKRFIQKANFIIGLKGLRNQRNFISTYFPEKQPILYLDDDIQEIVQLDTYTAKLTQSARRKQAMRPCTSLHNFIISAFQQAKTSGAYIWGVYPIANPYFMTPTVSTSLKFIVGPMYGVINRHLAHLRLTTDEKENVERTLQYFTLDGIVIRFNYISIITNYFSTPGGMQASLSRPKSTRKQAALSAAEYLHAKYPEITQIHTDKKSGWPELKLKKIKSNKAAGYQLTPPSTHGKTKRAKTNITQPALS